MSLINREEQGHTYNDISNVVKVLNHLIPAFLVMRFYTVTVGNNCSCRINEQRTEFCGVNACAE